MKAQMLNIFYRKKKFKIKSVVLLNMVYQLVYLEKSENLNSMHHVLK